VAVIAHDSRAQSSHNEDFFFSRELPGAQVFAVGDFAHSEYTGLDKLAVKLLEQSLKTPGLTSAPIPILLAHIASQLNNSLLNHHHGFNWRFQCCAAFAGISGDTLSYLSIGDCRLAVRRNEMLILLNGTVWLDAAGNLLPPVVTATQELQRGPEPPPSQALGIRQEFLSPSMVSEFSLEPNDQILLYSDGVDKVLSPGQLLTILEKNLKTQHPDQRQLDQIISLVLEEVEAHHGDDDRTLLIASGPHALVENNSMKAERDRLIKTQNEMEKRMRELEGNVASINDNIVQQLKKNDANVAEILRAVQELTNAVGEVREAQSRDSSAPIIARLENIAKELSSDLEALIVAAINQMNLRAGTDEPHFKLYTPLANVANGVARNADGAAAESVAAEIEPSASAPPPAVATELPQETTAPQDVSQQADSFVHIEQELRGNRDAAEEDVIYVHSQGWKLDYRREFTGKKKSHKSDQYIVRTKDAPAGWITCLYLLLIKHSAQDLHTNLTDSMTKAAEALELLRQRNPSLLDDFRSRHVALRRQRQYGAANIKPDEQLLSNALYEWLRSVDSEPKDIQVLGSETFVGPGTGPSMLQRWRAGLSQFLKSHPAIRPILIVTILAVAAAAFVFFYATTSQEEPGKRANVNANVHAAVAPPEKRFQLDYAGDGRTLVVMEDRSKPVRLGLRVVIGREDEFFTKIRDERFASKSDAEKWLSKPELSTYLADRGQPQVAPPGRRFYTVLPSDLSDTCPKFLARANGLLPAGVHNEFSDLTRLNPGMRCQDLQEGDDLLVYSKVPKK